jgi:hypothetical protein
VGIRALIKAGERLGVEPASNALDLVTRRTAILMLPCLGGSPHLRQRIRGACAFTVRAMLAGSKSSVTVGNRP